MGDKKKRVVVPQALRVLRLKQGRKYTTVGKLSSAVGWKYETVVDKLEEKRKLQSAEYSPRRRPWPRRWRALKLPLPVPKLPRSWPSSDTKYTIPSGTAAAIHKDFYKC